MTSTGDSRGMNKGLVQTMTKMRAGVSLFLSTVLFASVAFCEAQQPARDGASFTASLKRSAVPTAIDMMRNACASAVAARQIAPVKIRALPVTAQQPLRAVFPSAILDDVNCYFDVPFHDASIGVGLLSTLGMMSQGGGLVLAMTFENDVYLFCSRESLTDGPATLTVLAHELVHAAQYRALGYEGYKEMYAADLAEGLPYERLRIERDAYFFGSLFPKLVPPGFFAFLPGSPQNQKLLVAGELEDLGQQSNVTTQSVIITAEFEALERQAPLILTGGDGKQAFRVQIVDPLGGPPLHVFELAPESGTTLLLNAPAGLDGPYLVVVGNDSGAEIAWRGMDGFRSQWIPGKLAFADSTGDGMMNVKQETPERTATWWWTGNGFAMVNAGKLNESKPAEVRTE